LGERLGPAIHGFKTVVPSTAAAATLVTRHSTTTGREHVRKLEVTRRIEIVGIGCEWSWGICNDATGNGYVMCPKCQTGSESQCCKHHKEGN